MKKIKILIAEDDPSLKMVIAETLRLEGFEVSAAADGVEGLHLYEEYQPDVVIADIMMPRLDGLEMVRRMRQRGRRIPILFLTAKSTVESVVEGFEAGCDDYLRKPFSMRELIVRITALHQRMAIMEKDVDPNPPHLLRIGRYSLDTLSQFLTLDGENIKLSAKECELLKMLAMSVNKVVPASTIMYSLWHDDSYYVSKSLQVFITRIRRLLAGDSTIRIINARGEGYKLTIDMPE